MRTPSIDVMVFLLDTVPIAGVSFSISAALVTVIFILYLRSVRKFWDFPPCGAVFRRKPYSEIIIIWVEVVVIGAVQNVDNEISTYFKRIKQRKNSTNFLFVFVEKKIRKNDKNQTNFRHLINRKFSPDGAGNDYGGPVFQMVQRNEHIQF